MCEAGSVDVRDADDLFGYSVALSGDGLSLAAGAYDEDSNAIGVNGNAADNSAGGSGAAYVFTRLGNDSGVGVPGTPQYEAASNAGSVYLY